MPVTNPFRQHTQIRSSKTFSAALAAGIALQTGAVTIEDDLNALRSQAKRILGTTNWYDALNNRSLTGLDSAVDGLLTATKLFRAQVLTDVVVTAAQNWEALSVAGLETPTETASVGAVTTEGAVVAAHGGTFGTHSLALVAGTNALTPKNLCVVRDAATGQPLQSGGKDIYALLHSEVATDGHTFNDTTQRAQLSFVIENAGGTALIACPSADIAGKTINYSYVRRLQDQNLPEQAFLSGVFVDQTASVDVTLNNAIDNQTGAATQAQHIDIDIAAGFSWEWRDALSARLLAVTEGSGTGVSEVQVGADVDTLNVDAIVNDFASGIKAATGSTEIDLGVTAGVIESTGVADLRMFGAGALRMDDGNQGGSTWVGTAGVPLSDAAAGWTGYKSAFGEVGLLEAITAAKNSAAVTKGVAQVLSDVVAGVNVTGAGGSPNISVQLPDYSGVTFVSQVNVYYDGELLINAASSGVVDTDVYPGTTPANGDLMFNFELDADDAITVVVFG